jgi:hypothetical protein
MQNNDMIAARKFPLAFGLAAVAYKSLKVVM